MKVSWFFSDHLYRFKLSVYTVLLSWKVGITASHAIKMLNWTPKLGPRSIPGWKTLKFCKILYVTEHSLNDFGCIHACILHVLSVRLTRDNRASTVGSSFFRIMPIPPRSKMDCYYQLLQKKWVNQLKSWVRPTQVKYVKWIRQSTFLFSAPTKKSNLFEVTNKTFSMFRQLYEFQQLCREQPWLCKKWTCAHFILHVSVGENINRSSMQHRTFLLYCIATIVFIEIVRDSAMRNQCDIPKKPFFWRRRRLLIIHNFSNVFSTEGA